MPCITLSSGKTVCFEGNKYPDGDGNTLKFKPGGQTGPPYQQFGSNYNRSVQPAVGPSIAPNMQGAFENFQKQEEARKKRIATEELLPGVKGTVDKPQKAPTNVYNVPKPKGPAIFPMTPSVSAVSSTGVYKPSASVVQTMAKQKEEDPLGLVAAAKRSESRKGMSMGERMLQDGLEWVDENPELSAVLAPVVALGAAEVIPGIAAEAALIEAPAALTEAYQLGNSLYKGYQTIDKGVNAAQNLSKGNYAGAAGNIVDLGKSFIPGDKLNKVTDFGLDATSGALSGFGDTGTMEGTLRGTFDNTIADRGAQKIVGNKDSLGRNLIKENIKGAEQSVDPFKFNNGGYIIADKGLKTNNSEWMGNKLDKQGFVTSATKGGNRISFTGDARSDEWINKQLDTGNFGYNPKTGTVVRLDKPVQGLSKEDKIRGTEEFARATMSGFPSKQQQKDISKLSQEEQALINKTNQQKRENLVVAENSAALRNPVTYAPGAAFFGGIAAPYIGAGLEAATAALELPAVVGETTLPYVTGSNLLGLAGGVTGANMLSSDLNTGYYSSDDPMMDKVARGLETGLNVFGTPGMMKMMGKGFQPIIKGYPSIESSTIQTVNKPFGNTKITPELKTELQEWIPRRQFIKQLQKDGLIGKDFNINDLNYASRSTDKTNALTKLALDREATRFRGVRGSVPPDGKGVGEMGAFDMSRPSPFTKISEFENMRNAGVDFNDPISIAKYQASHIPMDQYGYRSGMPTLPHAEALYTDFSPTNYGKYQVKLTLPRDYSTGNYRDWYQKYFNPKNNLSNLAVENGYYKDNFMPESSFENPILLDPEYRANVVGKRGQKMFNVDEEFPFMDFKNLSPEDQLKFDLYKRKLKEDYNTGWRGQYSKGGFIKQNGGKNTKTMDTNKFKAQLAAMQDEINRTAEQYGLGGHLQQMMNGGEIHHLPVMPYGFAEDGIKLNTDTSIVDAMKFFGDDSSFANRKKVAESMGIKGYTGSPDQNKDLLQKYTTSKKTASKQPVVTAKKPVSTPNKPILNTTNFNSLSGFDKTTQDMITEIAARNNGKVFLTDKGTKSTIVGTVKNGKVQLQAFPILSGQMDKPGMYPNPYSYEQLGDNENVRYTPTGAFALDESQNIYGKPGFFLRGTDDAYHVTYPAEAAIRTPKYTDANINNNNMSYGCINGRCGDMATLTNMFNTGDSSYIIDTRLPYKDNVKMINTNKHKKIKEMGGMNSDQSDMYYAGGEIENDPHIMELYGFQGGGQIMEIPVAPYGYAEQGMEIPVAPYGYAEMGMMMGDDVTGKAKPTGAPTAPAMMSSMPSQNLAGLAFHYYSQDPMMQSDIPAAIGNKRLSDTDRLILQQAVKEMGSRMDPNGRIIPMTAQDIDRIKSTLKPLTPTTPQQRMGGMNYEDGGQMPMDVAVSRFKAAGKDKGLSGGELQMYVEKMKSKYNYQKGGVVSEKELGNYEVGMYGTGGIMYNGTKFPGYNKPISTAPGDKFRKQMILQKGGKIKLVKFGHR